MTAEPPPQISPFQAFGLKLDNIQVDHFQVTVIISRDDGDQDEELDAINQGSFVLREIDDRTYYAKRI